MRLSVLAAALAVAGCGGGETADEGMEMGDAATDADAAPMTGPSVTIEEPRAGQTYSGAVRVVLRAEGIEVAPVAEARPGTAHHHIFVDTDLTPLDQTIPAGDSSIIHLGGGESEYMLEGLTAGSHRIIALLADPAHVPLDPPAADTVEFDVR